MRKRTRKLNHSKRKGFAMVEGCVLMFFVIGVLMLLCLPAGDFLGEIAGVSAVKHRLALVVMVALCALHMEVFLPWQLQMDGTNCSHLRGPVEKLDLGQYVLWRVPVVMLVTAVMLCYWFNWTEATIWGMVGAGDVALLICGLIAAGSNVLVVSRNVNKA